MITSSVWSAGTRMSKDPSQCKAHLSRHGFANTWLQMPLQTPSAECRRASTAQPKAFSCEMLCGLQLLASQVTRQTLGQSARCRLECLCGTGCHGQHTLHSARFSERIAQPDRTNTLAIFLSLTSSQRPAPCEEPDSSGARSKLRLPGLLHKSSQTIGSRATYS